MSSSGWIPREQPRGPELRSYIPGLKENPKEANPPTFMWEFSYLMSQSAYEGTVKSWLPQIELWTQWWDTS